MKRAAVLLVLLAAATPLFAQLQGQEFRVNSQTSGSYVNATVSACPTGFVVVWDESNKGVVYARRYLLSGPSAADFVVSPSGDAQYAPAVAQASDGSFFVVWHGASKDDPAGINGIGFLADGSPAGPQFRVNSATTGSQQYAAVAAVPGGGFIVAWEGDDGDFGGVFARRFDAGFTPIGGDFAVNTTTSGYQQRPSVAAVQDVFWIVWSGQGGSDVDGVWARRFLADTTPVGGEFRVNTFTTYAQSGPSVAAETTNNTFVVAWSDEQAGPTNTDIYARRFTKSAVVQGLEFRVNTYTSGQQGRVRVARDPAQEFVILWDGEKHADPGIFGQRYGAAGAAAGPEFRVNTTTSGVFPAGASIAALGPYRWVVAWSSSNTGLGTADVLGQRLSFPIGDATGDGFVTVADVFWLINYLFAGGPYPVGAADVNGDHVLNVSDVFYLINFLFAGGPAPI